MDSAPHTSRFRSSWILVINVLIQNLLFSVGFHFFLKDHLVTFGYVTVVTTYLYNNKNFMKSCQLSKMLVFRTMGGVHVLRSCVSCLLLRLFINPYRLEQSKKENSYLTVPDPDLEIRGEGGAILRTLRRRFPKKIFRPFGLQFGLRIRGAGPPGALLWIRHCLSG